MHPNILVFDKYDWSKLSAREVETSVQKILSYKSHCSLMLTGGNTAKRLYEELAKLEDFPFHKIDFYFGDERCVLPDDLDSNYAMVKNSLFRGEVGKAKSIIRIEGELSSAQEAARDYAAKLPDNIDIVLLGMGFDGHVASLFPHSYALKDKYSKVFNIYNPSVKYRRITIGPRVIVESRTIFLLATSGEKGRILSRVYSLGVNHLNLPVCLAKTGTWLLDRDANDQLNKYRR